MITQKRSFFYNHLRTKLDNWCKEHPDKKPFVSIKVFEFDEMRMKVNLNYSSEPEIEIRKMKRIDDFKEVKLKKRRTYGNKLIRYDSGDVKEKLLLSTQETKIEIQNKFSILSFEEDEDEEINYKLESCDEVDTANCNLLEIVNPITVKPKRLIALPGEEYYFNTPENKIDDDLLNEMVDCRVFRLKRTPTINNSSQTDGLGFIEVETQTDHEETKSGEYEMKYENIQSKLRALKTIADNLMGKYSKNKLLQYKNWVKEYGFIKTVGLVLEYFDSTYDSDDTYDSNDNDEDIDS